MVQQHENIRYRPMSLERHSSSEVARLIYESAPELFTLMFGPLAVRHLTELVRRSHNRFSHQYIRIAEIDQQVIGIATLVPTDKINENPDFLDVLNFGQKLWLKLVQRILLQHVLQHGYPPGSFYIGNLAVAPEHRNCGIGRQLLSQCIAEASRVSSSLFISVDVHNPRAQKLYESLGFQVVATKAIRLIGMLIGSRTLSLDVRSPSLPHDTHLNLS